MTITTKIIAHSVNPDGKEIVTLQCRYPLWIHAQCLTHRLLENGQVEFLDLSVMQDKNLSRNAQSSRACPTEKLIDEVMNNPVIPVSWGANQSGMVAEKDLDEESAEEAKSMWLRFRDDSVHWARAFAQLGLHKQLTNRVLEPFRHVTVVITATEWENFFKLRLHETAQPEIQELARQIKEAIDHSEPEKLWWGDWHTPFAKEDVVTPVSMILSTRLQTSVAACARCSYNNLDGSNRSVEKDRALHDQLFEDGHWSPFEHAAKAAPGQYANFIGWKSYREKIKSTGKA